ncbi:hypothetical protein [uncultured Tessaracoccus sp.]|uniref:hypothetical protein n=1 Tax=uncultured Tessaracoccus sp. TaxID=905023 RepID=UPI00261FACA4|nr:hypothetical protein [uncultured Tessaracoccus sp.]
MQQSTSTGRHRVWGKRQATIQNAVLEVQRQRLLSMNADELFDEVAYTEVVTEEEQAAWMQRWESMSDPERERWHHDFVRARAEQWERQEEDLGLISKELRKELRKDDDARVEKWRKLLKSVPKEERESYRPSVPFVLAPDDLPPSGEKYERVLVAFDPETQRVADEYWRQYRENTDPEQLAAEDAYFDRWMQLSDEERASELAVQWQEWNEHTKHELAANPNYFEDQRKLPVVEDVPEEVRKRWEEQARLTLTLEAIDDLIDFEFALEEVNYTRAQGRRTRLQIEEALVQKLLGIEFGTGLGKERANRRIEDEALARIHWRGLDTDARDLADEQHTQRFAQIMALEAERGDTLYEAIVNMCRSKNKDKRNRELEAEADESYVMISLSEEIWKKGTKALDEGVAHWMKAAKHALYNKSLLPEKDRVGFGGITTDEREKAHKPDAENVVLRTALTESASVEEWDTDGITAEEVALGENGAQKYREAYAHIEDWVAEVHGEYEAMVWSRRVLEGKSVMDVVRELEATEGAPKWKKDKVGKVVATVTAQVKENIEEILKPLGFTKETLFA